MVYKATLIDAAGRVRGTMDSVTLKDTENFIMGGMAIFENQMKNAFEVTFGKGQPFAGEPILPTLKRLRDSTMSALEGLKQFL